MVLFGWRYSKHTIQIYSVVGSPEIEGLNGFEIVSDEFEHGFAYGESKSLFGHNPLNFGDLLFILFDDNLGDIFVSSFKPK